jgi:RHS repeat-associated protein
MIARAARMKRLFRRAAGRVGVHLTESLERRLQFAAVSWDGGGDGTAWADRFNWSSDQLPTSSDDVMISVAGNPTIQIGSAQSVNSFITDEAITITSGTFTVAAPSQANGPFTLAGGMLAGSGDVTVAGTLNWSSGAIAGAGKTILAPGAAWNLSGSGIKDLRRTIDNAGNATYSGTNLVFGNAAAQAGVINNLAGATFSVTGEGDLRRNFTATHAFNNAGTFAKSGPGTATTLLGVTFNNTGVVNLTTGTLALDTGGSTTPIEVQAGAALDFNATFSHAPGGTALSGAGTINFNTGTHAFSGQFLPSGTVNFNGGTITVANTINPANLGVIDSATVVFNAPQNFASLTLAGGTLGGSGDVTVAEMLNWSAGAMTGTGKTVVAPGASWALPGAGTKDLRRTVDNAGAATYSGTNLVFGNAGAQAGVINNLAGGTYSVTGDGDLRRNFTAAHAFNNAGTFSKSGAGTLTTFLGVALNNSGTVTFSSGTLSLDSGGSTAGPIDVVAGAALEFNGNFNHAFSGVAITGAGTVNFNAGTHTFAGQFLPTGAVNFNGGTVTIANTMSPGSLGTIDSATVVFNAPQSFAALSLAGGTVTGTGDVTITNALTWSAGAMTGTGKTVVAPGATWALPGAGTKDLRRTVDNAGAATYSGTNVVFGNAAAQAGVINNLAGAAFTVTGDGDLRRNFTSNHAFNNAGTLTKSGPGTVTTFLGVQLNNTGTVAFTAGTLALDSGSSVAGPINVVAGAALEFNGTFGHNAPGVSITGAGTVTFNTGNHVFAGAFLPTGTVNFNGGTITIGNPISPAAIGAIDSATVVFNAAQSLGSLTLAGGTLGGSGDVTINNSLTWSAGSMTGLGKTVIAAGAVWSLPGAGIKDLRRTVDNAGNATYGGTNLIFGNAAAQPGVVNNLTGATFTVTGEGDLRRNFSSAHEFNNAGTFTKSGPGTVTSFLGVALNNSGTVAFTGGTLSLDSGVSTSGPIDVVAGAALEFVGSFNHAAPGVAIKGAGTIAFHLGNHTFAGQFLPTGTVNFSGGNVTVGNTMPPVTLLPVDSGTVVFSAPQSFSTLTLAGGTIGGSGDVTVSGMLNWSAGVMIGPGKTAVAPGAAWNLIGTGVKDLRRTVDNAGSATYGGTNLVFGNAAAQAGVINNLPGGTFSVTGEGDLRRNFAAAHAFNNAGTFVKSGPGTTTTFLGVTFNNTGDLTVDAGVMDLGGSNVSFVGSSVLRSTPGSTLQLSPGSLTGTSRNSDHFSAQGRLLFTGTGARQLEVMGRDVGNVAAGHARNFTYGTIELASGANVTLVNNADNLPGAEALYVNNLIVPAGTTFNLNGINVYARAAQVNGTLLGGALNPVADGGALAFGQPFPGQIANSGEVDAWTVFGRAGRGLSVSVTPSNAAILPPLNFAAVEILNPDGSVLAAADNVAGGSGSVLNLLGLTLPADGTYTIRIKAHADRVDATGRYVLTPFDSTVDERSLALGQHATGAVENPYALDRWTFSANALTQVQFRLINRSSADVVFTLSGPEGYTGFADLGADSALTNLPATGQYTLTARALGAGTGTYAFRLDQTSQIDLPPGQSVAGTLSGTGFTQLYRIDVPTTKPLFISLDDSTNADRNEVYVKFGVPPTRANYDYRHSGAAAADHGVLVPSAAAGTWYVLVYGSHVPVASDYTIRATTSDVRVGGVTPDRHGATGTVTMTVSGAGFDNNTQIALVAAGGATFPAATVSADSFTRITATFDLNGVPQGVYSVRATRPGGDSDTLANAFTVTAGGTPRLQTRLVMPGALGRHAVATIYLEYANTGNAAMPAPLLVLKSADANNSDRPILTLDASRIIQNYWSAGLPPGTSNDVFVLASGAQPGVLNPGERVQLPVYYLGLQQPWNFSDNQVEMEIRYWTADDPTPIDWNARKDALRPSTLDAATWDVVYQNLTGDLATTGAYVRMLADNARFLGRLGERVVDVDDLWSFEAQQAYGYSAMPVLDAATDASMPTPGVTLAFGRRFSSTVRDRNSSGMFGRGWFTPWQARLAVEGGGDLVKLVGEGGSARLYSRDTRNGKYFSGAGDSSELKASGGGLYELRDAEGVVTRFRADGSIGSVEDPNGNRVTAGYDASGRLFTLTHTSGASITLSYNGAGLVSGATDSAGRSTRYAYDPTGTFLTSVTTDDGKVTTYTYDTTGTPAQRNALTSVTRGGTTRQFVFDTRGRLDNISLAASDALIDFAYDSAGGVSVTDAAGTTNLFFDHESQLRKVTGALGNTTTLEYDAGGRISRIVSPNGENQSFAWSSIGALTSATDELGRTMTFAYDNPFRLLTRFTDARGNATTYAYDARGNLLSKGYADGSAERFGNPTAAGLAQQHTNRRNQAVAYTYLPSGQVDVRTFADGSYADFDYDARGSLTKVTEHPASGPDKVTQYAYDLDVDGDRLRKVTYPDGRFVEYFYDALGRRRRMADSAGQVTQYDYDSAGRFWRVRGAGNDVIAEYLYNATGRLQRINKGNGTYTTYTYDAAGQLLHLVNHAPDGSVNSRFDYGYDTRSRRRTMSTLEGSWAYSYDGAGQLTRAVFTSNNPAAVPNQDLQYFFDAAGNRDYTIVNGTRTEYTANNVNEYVDVGGAAYQYDEGGNLTFDGERTYTYDALGRLVRVAGPAGVAEYEYNAFGDRIASVVDGQRTEYLLDPTGLVNVVAEYDEAGDLVAGNVHGFGLLARFNGGTAGYFDFDAIGSTAGISNPGGAYVNRYTYSPFGSELSASGGFDNPFRFVGQFGVTQEAGGTHFMRARFYSDSTGRFTSPDPLGLGGRDSNLYRYVGNSPVRFIDPLGLENPLAEWGISFFGGIFMDVTGSYANGEDPDIGGSIIGNGVTIPGMPTGGSAVAFALDPDNAVNIVNGLQGLDRQRNEGTVNRGAARQLRELDREMGWDDDAGGDDGAGDGSAGGEGDDEGEVDSPGDGGGGGGGGGEGDSGGSGASGSVDPNEKFGAIGVGPQHWIRAGGLIPYRINFENLGPGSRDANGNPFPTFATAPAQRVTITDQLEGDLDWASFRLVELGFGDAVVTIPADSTHFTGSVPMTFDGRTFVVELEAGIDLRTGVAFATFQSIDPLTSLPPDVLTGFLPPEDGTDRGKGHFLFTIRTKPDLAHATEIRNVALISFDGQTIIATNQVNPLDPAAGIDPEKEALNTIDAAAPSSQVAPLAPNVHTPHFVVRWSGQDGVDGAGVGTYNVYVSDDGAAPTLWLSNTASTEGIYPGSLGHTYAFYSVGRDKVGNDESPPEAPDAVTTVTPGVAGRFVFYNNSGLDGNDAAANTADAAAIAGKHPLLPGQTATFANVSSYDRGINGVMVDVTGAAGLTLNDFVFRIGSGPMPSAWASAPTPTLSVTPGTGVGGSDRVTLIWPDGAVRNTWLQVTLLSNLRTGLAAPDVFYFGTLIGETGDDPRATFVGARDMVAVRRNFGSVASSPARDRFDFNKDGLVDAVDVVLQRWNVGRTLPLMSAPAVAAPASAPVAPPATVAPPRRRSLWEQVAGL